MPVTAMLKLHCISRAKRHVQSAWGLCSWVLIDKSDTLIHWTGENIQQDNATPHMAHVNGVEWETVAFTQMRCTAIIQVNFTGNTRWYAKHFSFSDFRTAAKVVHAEYGQKISTASDARKEASGKWLSFLPWNFISCQSTDSFNTDSTLSTVFSKQFGMHYIQITL